MSSLQFSTRVSHFVYAYMMHDIIPTYNMMMSLYVYDRFNNDSDLPRYTRKM